MRRYFQSLEIGGKSLSHHFEFEIVSEMGSFFETAEIRILKNYYYQSALSVSAGDEVKISFGYDKESIYEQFQGKIERGSENKTHIILFARNFSELSETMKKTYEEIEIKTVLNELLNKLDYSLPPLKLKTLIADGKKIDIVKKIIRTAEEITGKKIYCYIDYDQIVITNEIKKREWDISLEAIETGKIIRIIGNPNLKLGDTLLFNGEAHQVSKIHNFGSIMVCSGVRG
ncbi:MAG TPA: hypothetical protein DHW82_01975 [Spirochaetia bacterium]|nr:MAG: hypothetical protein A2Y41_07310 [Spirochaetes bacterium GWB1_36_13]HCL55764.1 hypothetical protein [Spirochaetia bacterium]